MVILTIGSRVKLHLPSVELAQAKYNELRDASGEGARDWPNGTITVDTRKIHLSYNGRMWAKRSGAANNVEVFA